MPSPATNRQQKVTDAPAEHTWKQISDELKSAVGASLFDVWLAPLKLAKLDGNQLILEAPAASRAWVNDRFGQIIKVSAQSIIGADAEVQVSAAGDASRLGALAMEQRQRAVDGDEINPKYCFEQFVIGNGNRLAHGAALAVAENPGTAYNPLFICGPPGVGKTHLLHSIADYATRHGNGVRVQLTGGESFANQFISALRGGDINAFKARHREADLVLVDDVQFLMAKAKTEEEFFHTFNALRESGAQIVLTCDRPPSDLDKLEERLRDRFDSGLVADISAPDLATRIAVLRARTELDQLIIEEQAVLEVIASRVERNLRALEGALIRVVAFASLSGRAITESLAEEVLDGLFPQKRAELRPQKPAVETIRNEVASYYGVSVTELCSASRLAAVLWPRQVAMYMAREHSGSSLTTIAASFGGRNHTTALNACKRVEQRAATDREVASELRELGDHLFKTTAENSSDRVR